MASAANILNEMNETMQLGSLTMWQTDRVKQQFISRMTHQWFHSTDEATEYER